MNGTADNTHYTTSVLMEKQSQLEIAVHSGVLCTLNARNELSQHGVHDKQTVRFYCHITLQTPVCVCAKNASVANPVHYLLVRTPASRTHTPFSLHFHSSILDS